MAVMTTQQSEGAGALLNEKLPQSTLPVDKEGLNGDLEVNGHSSPRIDPAESKEAEGAPALNGEPSTTESKVNQNQDAFSSNQALPDEKDSDGKAAELPNLGPDHDIASDMTSDMNKVKMDDAAPPVDTDMPDAPTERVSDDHASEGVSPKSHPQSAPAPASDIKDEEEKEAPADATEAPKESAPVDAKADDVAMEDAEEVETAPSAPTVSSDDVQDAIKVSPLPRASPKGDAESATADSQATATDATKDAPAGSPPAPATADTSMSESAPLSAKIPRERDVDSEDEPVAKRTKVGHAGNGEQPKADKAAERMEVDQATQGGGAKNLGDDALNDSPITDWQNKQIRQVLAGVKKTKVGGLFRLPVQQLWPALWADYSVKVTNPTDISSMEKRLRGDGPRYATMGEFKQDLELMVQNSVDFNGEVHDVTTQARACRDAILTRLTQQSAVEPVKPERKESAKAHSTRHVEPRATAPPVTTTGVARPSKGAANSPATPSGNAAKPVPESPAFALPPGSNGVPLIRRDSTKPESRTKRPVKPAHSKDLVYDTKRKKKLPLELRFCDEVLTELRKSKHYDINAAFMQPVDPVALNIPTYHKVIKRPMDLGTIGNKLASGEYTSAKEFEKDFDLMIKNCRTFNGEDHLIYNAALKLQDLFRAEMSRKDEWMARHAPVSAAAPSYTAASPHHDDSESEAESEHDGDDEERKQIESRLATIAKRLDQEQKKVTEMVNSGTADITDVEVAQSVVAMLQKQLMQEKAKLANLPAKKPSKPKPAKAKKAGGAASGGAKKATVAGGSTAAARKSGGTKKAAPKRKIGPLEKEIIIECIGEIDGNLLAKAIDLIKKDTGQGENAAGELELDIDMVSEEALNELYKIALKANPNARAEKERQHYASGQAAPPPPPDPLAAQLGSKSSGGKSKKNKPMSKSEQERRIQQLNELRAQAGRQGSGSQEPMESIEGNGNDSIILNAEHESEEEEEVDSEED